MSDSTKETQEHINRVGEFIGVIITGLVDRACKHDASKLKEPEKAIFDEVSGKLKEMTYGSKEYFAQFEKMRPALDHHYAKNSHHPEYHAAGIKGMDLIDIIEMFCDWCAATERHDDGNIGRSINNNMDRFGYEEILASIFVNTAQHYCMGKRNHVAYRNWMYDEAVARGDEAKKEELQACAKIQ